MTLSAKSRRIEVRVSDDERRLEEAAAAALGLTLSEFVRQAARSRAQEVMREHGEIHLSDTDAQAFLAALDADAPPPESMRDLFARPLPWSA